jgi:tetratricopeptide (TPR) repeat protein
LKKRLRNGYKKETRQGMGCAMGLFGKKTKQASTANKEVDFNPKEFKAWLALRERFIKAKREKNYKSVIELGNRIIAIAKSAPTIGIFVPSFEYDIAEAYNKQQEFSSSLEYYKRSMKSFEKYRATAKLHNPDDCLSDIAKIKRKISKLEQSSGTQTKQPK